MRYRLAYVLSNIDDFTWSDALFLPSDEVWDADSMVMILDPDDVDEDEELPEAAKNAGYEYALDVQTVQSIVKNVLAQTAEISPTVLLDAFLYYYDNDAFIEL